MNTNTDGGDGANVDDTDLNVQRLDGPSPGAAILDAANPDAAILDVAVVGAGLAGLLAAIAAARAGAKVMLIERGRVGGRARSTQSNAGFCLNRGPHALYLGHPLDRALRSFGIEPAGSAPSQRGARGLIDGRLGRLPGGPFSLLATDLVPARDKLALARQLVAIGRLDPAEYRHRSVDQWITELGLPPAVGRLIAALARLTTYCADTDIASAEAAIGQIQSGLSSGVLYLDRGWQQLVDALTTAATSLGVEIRTGRQVHQIEGSSVRFDDEVLRARAVVAAGLNPAQVSQLISGSPDLGVAAGPAVTAATLDIGVSGSAAPGLVLGLDEPVYLNRHDPPAALAPAGHSLYAALRYLRRDDHPDRDDVADRLLRLAVQAGLAPDSIVETRYSHRLTVADGQPLAGSGGLRGRPDIDATRVPGVFLAGDWIGPVGLLADASAASALRAAERAVAHARAHA